MAVRVSGATDAFFRSAGFSQNDPSTICFWVRRDSASAFGCLHVVANSGGTQYEYLGLDGTGTTLRLETQGTSANGTTTLTAGTWYHVARVRNGTGRTVYLNGVSEVTLTSANAFTSASEGFAGNGAVAFPGYMAGLKIFDRALTQDEVLQEMRTIRPVSVTNLNTFSPLFRHTELQNYAGTGWSISGTGLTDDGPPVSWGSPILLVPFAASGPAAPIYGFQGDAFQFGQYAPSASTGVNGTLDVSIGNITVTATGRVEIHGTGANNTIANVTAAGLGTVLVQGTGANNTIGAVTATATGTVLVQGTGANNTIGDFTLTGTGVIGASVSGTLDKTIDAVTASATGQVRVAGTGANNTIAAVTAAGTGQVEVRGTGANNTIAAVTAAGLGTVRIAGTGANNTIGAFTVAATGTVRIVGTLSKTIDPVTATATGSVENRGTLAVTIGAVTAAGTGVVGNFISGQLNQSIGIFTVTATAGVQNTVRSMGATIKQGTFNGSVHAKPYSKSRFRQESMKWPSKG